MDWTLQQDLLLKYPLVLTLVENEEYKGYVSVKGKYYEIHLKEEKTGKLHLQMNKDLQSFAVQIRKLQGERNVFAYLDALVEIISSAPVEAKQQTKNHTNIYRTVLKEYYELRQFYINIHRATLSADLRRIAIEQLDSNNRKHEIVIGVNYDDGSKDKLFKVIRSDLPYTEFDSDDSLMTLFQKILAAIESPKLQATLDMMDEIDRNCWIVDPDKPTRKDLYRRIMLDEDTSVVVTFNAPDLPQIKLLGPQRSVRKYTENLNRNLYKWDPNEDVLQSLMQLLEISHFPPKPKDFNAQELLVNQGECCICFSMRLNGKAPEIICPNQACNQYFHTECLYEWLSSLNSRKFYSEIVGQCPNCEKTIYCPLTKSW